MPTRKPAKSPDARRPKKRADTVERARRALERTSEKPPVHTDDPAKDKSEMEGSVIAPLPHAD